MLAGCDITDEDIVTVYGPPTEEDSYQDSAESADDTVRGQEIKNFRDMIADKYPEVGNGNSGGYSYDDDGVREVYVLPEVSVE